MTTSQRAHRVCRRFAVALACSASVMTAQASEPDQYDGFDGQASSGQTASWSQGEARGALRRLPGVSAPIDSGTPEIQASSDQNFEGAAWKTKMAFERLELRAANEPLQRRPPGALQRCSAESSITPTELNGGVTSIATPQSGGKVRWLRSSSASDCARRARVLIDRASIEYSSAAWLSAEATVWEAFRCAAEGIDLQERELAKVQLGIRRRTATGRLQFARTAIREARDFTGMYGAADGSVISRMAISHSTDVLDGLPCDTLSGSDAADRYLDSARIALAEIASRSIEAAQGMDLLAAIYLKQNEVPKLHNATALCLRRAALQGQPDNSSLASRLGMHLLDVGLLEEARWALSHSLSIEKDEPTTQAYIAVLYQTGRQAEAQQLIATLPAAPSSIVKAAHVPAITELSPQDFAAISRPVMPSSARGSLKATPVSVTQQATPVSVTQRIQPQAPSAIRQDQRSVNPIDALPYGSKAEIEAKPNLFKRFAESVRNIW